MHSIRKFSSLPAPAAPSFLSKTQQDLENKEIKRLGPSVSEKKRMLFFINYSALWFDLLHSLNILSKAFAEHRVNTYKLHHVYALFNLMVWDLGYVLPFCGHRVFYLICQIDTEEECVKGSENQGIRLKHSKDPAVTWEVLHRNEKALNIMGYYWQMLPVICWQQSWG